MDCRLMSWQLHLEGKMLLLVTGMQRYRLVVKS
jgi:hypothetical protein